MRSDSAIPAKEHLLNVAVFTEVSKESGRRSVISVRLRDLEWRCIANLLSLTASIKAGLSLVLGA